MGEKDISGDAGESELRAFTRALLDDVRALEHMLETEMFETGIRRIGAEQEIFLVDSGGQPAPVAMETLARINDPAFTTELAKFNLEANLPPYVFGGNCLSRMEGDLRALMEKARVAAQACGADVLLTGILPTLQLSDLGLNNMTPVARYAALNRAMVKLRGGNFHVRIKGVDEFFTVHDNVMLESCNTSFQIHMQAAPDEFAKIYNYAQAVTGPVLAAAVNSPLLVERRLWQETRVALFQHSVDDRSETMAARGQRPRVRFGDGWIRESVLEIFRDDIARFRVVLATDIDEHPMAVLDRGEIPQLRALRMHNGTVYRWNRPCYGISENGKPHLRIENRVLPAGPSIIDEMANAAFYFGLLAGLANEYPDITKVLPFDDAKGNFLAAARHGLRAQLTWIGGESSSARELISNRLLPFAREGLEEHGLDKDDIDRYLDVLEARVANGRTGSQWALDSLAAMSTGTRHDKVRALTAASLARQKENTPVHTWSNAASEEALDWRHSYRTVGQFMTKDLFTVQPDDLVDLAANLMDWEHIRHVPVEDEEGRLVGLVSHRALLRHVARGRTGTGGPATPVRDLMQDNPVTVLPETPTLDAIELMRKHRVGCLPVVSSGKLVGIITESDLVNVAARLFEEQLRGLRGE